MHEFNSWIFKEDEIKTNNQKVLKERTYYLGVLIFAIGALFYVLELEYLSFIIIIGYLVIVAGQIVMSGQRPSVGHHPTALKLIKGEVHIGSSKLEIKNKFDAQITIVGYKGQPIYQQQALYRTHSGNGNVIRIKTPKGPTELNFVLNSVHHKEKLIEFCKNNGVDYYDPNPSL